MNTHEKGNTCNCSCGDWKNCSCGHHTIVPIVAILFASTFLLGYQGVLSAEAVNVIWPILVGIGGVVKLVESKCGCC